MIRRIVNALLWLCLGIYAASAVHDFYTYVDGAIYLAVDDSEANISYALATEGRYGFLASPVLVGTARHQGQFNYGPWYFYLGAGLIWLFGYSLTLLRSIHLFVILGIVAGASVWFKGDDRAPVTAALGFALLYCFGAAQWPMARPDSMVSAMAIVFVMSAGAAILHKQARYWFVAGLAATCAAFSHLIAWALVAAAVAVFAVASAFDLNSDGRAAIRRGGVAMAGGMAAGVGMFYASFGFDVARQLRFLASYREITASPEPYFTVLQRHWNLAYSYLPAPMQVAVVALLPLSWIVAVRSVRLPERERRTICAYLLPPLAAWTAYVVSLGRFTNFHNGYAILNQVLAWWTLSALLWLGLGAVRRRARAVGAFVPVMASLLVLSVGVRLTAASAGPASDKLRKARDWVPIDAYVNQVLDQLPARATAWGTVMYGIEHPSRVQLVQLADALKIIDRIPAGDHRTLAPSYLLWGYPENRDSTLSSLRGGDDLLLRVTSRFPEDSYVPVALVAGVPYGVTRIYARVTPEAAGHRSLPAVRVYDTVRRDWRDRIGPALPSTFSPHEPLTFRIGYEGEPTPHQVTGTISCDLARGVYLVRLTVRPGAGPGPRMIAVTSEGQTDQTMGELGPDGAFAPYLAQDTVVDLVHTHSGGPLFVSQVDRGAGAAIQHVELFPVQRLVEDRETPAGVSFEPVAPASWVPETPSGVRAEVAATAISVEGNASQYGYQIVGPTMAAQPRSRITVRVAVAQERGRVCVGVLNGTKQTWLVAPTHVLPEYTFDADRTAAFHLVVANCNQGASGNPASRFTIAQAAVAIENPDLYVDRLMRAFAAAPVPAGKDSK